MRPSPRTFLPLEIVGGGLAGLALGCALRREGVPVSIYEAGDYPRHRVCGEFITGLSAATIERLGLEAPLRGALRHHEVAWTFRDGPPQFQRLPEPALGLSRHELDARLARAFVAAGGKLHTNTRLTDRANPPGRVFAFGRRRSLESPWIGLKAHVRNLPLIRDLEMHLGEDCYAGLTRVESGVVNVCGLFRRRKLTGRGSALLLRYLRAAGLRGLSDRLESGEFDVRSFCAVAALDFERRVTPLDRILIGDAVAMIPPFTGNGMAMAFQSAEAALSPVLAYARGESDWKATCRATYTALHGRFRVRLASARALHPFLLRPRRQRWFAALGRARLLPLGSLYSWLH